MGFLFGENIEVCELVKLHHNYIWLYTHTTIDRKNVMYTSELSTRPIQKNRYSLSGGIWSYRKNIGYYLPFLDGDLDFLKGEL